MKPMLRAALPLAILFALTAFGQDLPDGPGKELVERTCSSCHGVDTVLVGRQTRSAWTETVYDMRGRGASATDAECEKIIDYLAKNFGLPKVNINKASESELEEQLNLSKAESEAIIKYRTEHGSFKDWSAITKVSGVDSNKLERNREIITFE